MVKTAADGDDGGDMESRRRPGTSEATAVGWRASEVLHERAGLGGAAAIWGQCGRHETRKGALGPGSVAEMKSWSNSNGYFTIACACCSCSQRALDRPQLAQRAG